MWPFTRKYSMSDSGLLRGFTDWHCHILPGVDDGIPTMDAALEVLARYEEWGVREVWLTPHIMEDVPNTPVKLKERYAELKAAYQGPVVLHLAAENMLDSLFEERLESGELLPIGPKGEHLLVETSYFNPPMDLFDLLERIRDKGYKIILAHPERYVYMTPFDYERLKGEHVLFQSNLTSLAGLYGKEAKAKAEMFLLKHWTNYLGTDLHRLTAIERAVSAKTFIKTVRDSLLSVR